MVRWRLTPIKAFTGGWIMQKIQVLKCTLVSGKNERGTYSFFRLASVFFDEKGNPEAVGDIISDVEVIPGSYPVSFSVASFQGKLTAKITPVTVPSAAVPSKS
jgi:hypothetical protein